MIEIEGAINRLTAATMALATTVETAHAESAQDERDAAETVEERYEDHLDTLLEG